MSQGEILTENIEATLERFKAARDLGAVALNLKRQSEQILKSITQLGLEKLSVPDDIVIRLIPNNPEDPMYAEHYNHFPHYIPHWELSQTRHKPHQENMDLGPSGYSFTPRSLEWDEESKTIWAYNEAKNFRVAFREGIRLQLLDDLTGTD